MAFFKCIDELPVITGFDDCNPKFKFGEIEMIILSHVYLEVDDSEVDVYPTDESSVDAWDDILNPGTAFIVPVRGTLTEPDQTEIDASRDRKAYPPAEWTLECRVDDLEDSVYNALRQYRNKGVRLWFIAGGHIFGGRTGIIATANGHLVIEEGFDTMHNFHLNMNWRSAEVPERNDAPAFDEEES